MPSCGDHIVVMESLDPTPYRSQSSYIIGKYRSSEYGVGYSLDWWDDVPEVPAKIGSLLYQLPTLAKTTGAEK